MSLQLETKSEADEQGSVMPYKTSSPVHAQSPSEIIWLEGTHHQAFNVLKLRNFSNF